MFLNWTLCLLPFALFSREKWGGEGGRLGRTEKPFNNSTSSISLPPQFYFRQSFPLRLLGFHDNCSHLESSLHDTSVFQWPKPNVLLKMLSCSTLFFRGCSFLNAFSCLLDRKHLIYEANFILSFHNFVIDTR